MEDVGEEALQQGHRYLQEGFLPSAEAGELGLCFRDYLRDLGLPLSGGPQQLFAKLREETFGWDGERI